MFNVHQTSQLPQSFIYGSREVKMMWGLPSYVTLVIGFAVSVAGQAVPVVSNDIGVTARPFDISQVVLNDGRVQQNQVSSLPA
jgi:hypothetical protein